MGKEDSRLNTSSRDSQTKLSTSIVDLSLTKDVVNKSTARVWMGRGGQDRG